MVRIAIIGAGLCGLATSRAIIRSCPSAKIRIFESKPDEAQTAASSYHRHGIRILLTSGISDYSLTDSLLRLSTGSISALRQLGLQYDNDDDDGRPLAYYDHAGTRLLYSVRAPSLNAISLRRDLLAQSEVEYGAKVDHCQELFDSFDVVIGCDGRRSVLRPIMDYVVDQSERDLGLRRIRFDVPFTAFDAAQHYDLAFVGQRSMAMVTRYGQRLRASLVSPFQFDEDDLIGSYRDLTRDWLHPVRDLIDHLDHDSALTCELLRDRDPVKLRPSAETSPVRFALAGDALWSLAPYTGHTAGVALADAVSIATVLADGSQDLLPYWRQLQNAAAPFVDEARAMLQFMHGDTIAEHLIELQRRQQQQKQEQPR